jgi:acetyltransferase-like isoleucine patch superfamily enzyme
MSCLQNQKGIKKHSVPKRAGVNSTVRDFTDIEDDCFIAMDASVTSNMPEGAVALGNSAKILLRDDRRAKIIKKNYFQF